MTYAYQRKFPDGYIGTQAKETQIHKKRRNKNNKQKGVQGEEKKEQGVKRSPEQFLGS